MKLSDTQTLILSRASQHEKRIASPPPAMAAIAFRNSVAALVKAGLLVEVGVGPEQASLAYRKDDDGVPMVGVLSKAGREAIGVEDPPAAECPVAAPAAATDGQGDEPQAEEAPAEAVHVAPTPAPSAFLITFSCEMAADAADRIASILRSHGGSLGQAVESVVPSKGGRTKRADGAPRNPRAGTKQEKVLEMLRQQGGTTIAEISDAMGWQSHTVRGFFAGLKKKGIDVAREDGEPGEEGGRARSIYRIAE